MRDKRIETPIFNGFRGTVPMKLNSPVYGTHHENRKQIRKLCTPRPRPSLVRAGDRIVADGRRGVVRRVYTPTYFPKEHPLNPYTVMVYARFGSGKTAKDETFAMYSHHFPEEVQVYPRPCFITHEVRDLFFRTDDSLPF